MKAKVLAVAAFSVFATSAGVLAHAADSYYTTDFNAQIPRTSNAITPDDQVRAAMGVSANTGSSRDGR